jgi:Zn-finger nucleic acid-binding protein
MKCPTCNVELKMTDRQGVEIDYCPNCRGVWLDRGELDKIIDRAAEAEFARPVAQAPYRDDDYDREHGRPYHKKKRGFLGNMFDFD